MCPVVLGYWMSRNRTSGACASTSRRVAMPSPVCATMSRSGQSEPSSSASSSRSSGSSSAMMARGLGSTSVRLLCSHAAAAVASWRVACIAIRKASAGGRAILARHGLVCRQTLPFCDDDDSLDVPRCELALGAADYRGVHRDHGRPVHGDRDAERHQTNSAFHGKSPFIHACTLRDRKSTRLNSSHANISYAVFCLKKKNIPPSLLLRLD